MKRLFATGSLLAMLAFVPACAQTGGAPSPSGLSGKDRAFVKAAALGGMAEYQLGQLVPQRASYPEVKMFGDRMVQDHLGANARLMGLAYEKGAAIPADLDPAHKAIREKLEKTSGPEFDRQYMEGMVKDHKLVVELFEKQAESGDDPELKAFAAQSLPTLREHLVIAQELDRRLEMETKSMSRMQRTQ